MKIDPRIEAILLKQWDPIGINNDPAAVSEYYTYASQIYGMIKNGKSEKDIAEYLIRVTEEDLGLLPDQRKIEEIAKVLFKLTDKKV